MIHRRIDISLTALLAAGVLAGCASGVRLPAPSAPLPPAYEAAQAPPGQTPTAALDRWWTLFDDPQLTGLVEEALARAPDAKTALAKLAEARADRIETIAGLFPQGNLQGTGAEQDSHTTYGGSAISAFSGVGTTGTSSASGGGTGGGTGTTSSGGTAGGGSAISGSQAGFLLGQGAGQAYTASFNVTWELDFFGRDLATVKAANADLAAARFDYEASRLSLAAEVATDLFQARGLAVQLDDAHENAALAKRLYESGKRKSDAGLGTTADTARLESDYESAQAQTAGIEAQLRGAQRSLLVLIGRGGAPSSSLPIEAKVFAPPPAPPNTPGDLLARRPDVVEARARLASAADKLKLDKLALFPTFTLQPGAQYSRSVFPGFSSTTNLWSIGVGFLVPVLNRPKLIAEVHAQKARGVQAVAAYEKAVQSAYGDAERALTTLDADERRTTLLQTATQRSRFAFDAASKGYDLGLTDLTTLVQAEQSWRNTRATYTSAQISALVDAVATFKALGGGWDATTPRSDTAVAREAARTLK